MFQALVERTRLGTSWPVDRRSCHHLNRTSEQHKSANDHRARSGANAFNESVRRGRRPTVIRRRSRSPHLQPARSLPSRWAGRCHRTFRGDPVWLGVGGRFLSAGCREHGDVVLATGRKCGDGRSCLGDSQAVGLRLSEDVFQHHLVGMKRCLDRTQGRKTRRPYQRTTNTNNINPLRRAPTGRPLPTFTKPSPPKWAANGRPPLPNSRSSVTCVGMANESRLSPHSFLLADRLALMPGRVSISVVVLPPGFVANNIRPMAIPQDSSTMNAASEGWRSH